MTASIVSPLLRLLRLALLGSAMFMVLGAPPAAAQFLCTNFNTGDAGFSTAPGSNFACGFGLAHRLNLSTPLVIHGSYSNGGGSEHVGRVGMAVEF